MSFDAATRDNNQRCGKSSPTMAKRAMRPNVRINLLGLIISQRDGELRASKRRGIPINDNGGGELLDFGFTEFLRFLIPLDAMKKQ